MAGMPKVEGPTARVCPAATDPQDTLVTAAAGAVIAANRLRATAGPASIAVER